jgi:bifunctional ADP-heptose synthase (sugar kinase/adenylyltransferase)
MLFINIPDSFFSSKILALDRVINIILELKEQHKTVGLCHGGFDLLHPSYIKHFESAKKLCNVFGVSVMSDRFVECRKGDGWSVFSKQLQADGIAMLSGSTLL